MHYSAYSDAFLGQLAAKVRAVKGGGAVWVIFDNTAAGATVENALALLEATISEEPRGSTPLGSPWRSETGCGDLTRSLRICLPSTTVKDGGRGAAVLAAGLEPARACAQ